MSDTPLSLPADDSAVPSFAELGLPAPLVAALARQGIEAPFPIQAAAIPDVLAGKDVLGRGKTGSGKTLAFGLPMLTLLGGQKAAPKRPLGLIMVPTRELAMQVQDSLEPLGRSLGLRFKTVIGQTSMPRQIDALRRGVEILVATPGRLKDLMQQGAADLSDVQVTVLDEADHMADMGFLPDVTDILDQVRPDGQRLLFSATLDRDVDVLVQRYLTDPVTHAIGPVDESVATMEHHLLLVAPKDKNAITAEIANREGRTILFARTKHGVDRLAKQLAAVGVRAAGLHGGKSQNLRTRTLAEFREGNIGVLVATDVAARGIHVDDVSLVVHIDPPADHKDYMHRAGRTARAGESGVVVTLVLPHQVRSTSAMTRRAGIDAPRHKVASGDVELVKLTGARPPSGIPIEGPIIPERPARPAAAAASSAAAEAVARAASRTVTATAAPARRAVTPPPAATSAKAAPARTAEAPPTAAAPALTAATAARATVALALTAATAVLAMAAPAPTVATSAPATALAPTAGTTARVVVVLAHMAATAAPAMVVPAHMAATTARVTVVPATGLARTVGVMAGPGRTGGVMVGRGPGSAMAGPGPMPGSAAATGGRGTARTARPRMRALAAGLGPGLARAVRGRTAGTRGRASRAGGTRAAPPGRADALPGFSTAQSTDVIHRLCTKAQPVDNVMP